MIEAGGHDLDAALSGPLESEAGGALAGQSGIGAGIAARFARDPDRQVNKAAAPAHAQFTLREDGAIEHRVAQICTGIAG